MLAGCQSTQTAEIADTSSERQNLDLIRKNGQTTEATDSEPAPEQNTPMVRVPTAPVEEIGLSDQAMAEIDEVEAELEAETGLDVELSIDDSVLESIYAIELQQFEDQQ